MTAPAPADPPPPDPALLPLVTMDHGLLLCPACGSDDLMPTVHAGVLHCEACDALCGRFTDQCQNCGARGITQSEQVAFPAPGQSPKEAKSTFVKRCENCGYVSTGF